jgi:hypothetical protein
MNIRPLYDRIVVKRIDEETTRHGIIIPDSAQEKPQEAKSSRQATAKGSRAARCQAMLSSVPFPRKRLQPDEIRPVHFLLGLETTAYRSYSSLRPFV